MKKICKICGDEVWHNGCKYVHGRVIAGVPGIDKIDYNHEAVYIDETENEQVVEADAEGRCGVCDFELKTTGGKYCSNCGTKHRTA